MDVPLAAVIRLESGSSVSLRGLIRYATAMGRPITLKSSPKSPKNRFTCGPMHKPVLFLRPRALW